MHFSVSSLLDISALDWVIGGLLMFFFIVQLLFYTLLYRKPYRTEQRKVKNIVPEVELPPVSIVIASKNESEDLARNLPAILGQDYPNFEVIVVNGGSTDETDVLLKALQQEHKNLYYTYVPVDAETLNERKLALTIGIKAAKKEILLFTEAYCRPVSNQWIREYAMEFAKGRDVVLGFCCLDINKKTRMRRFMMYDNLMEGLRYLSMAIIGKPFMGIGRNMAFRRNLFFDNKGFSSLLNIDGGEDDLFINRVANGKNTGVVVSTDSLTETNIVNSFYVWRALKSKYLYTKQFYKGGQITMWGCESFTRYAFFASVVGAIVSGLFLQSTLLLPVLGVLLFFVRYSVQLGIINRNAKLLGAGRYHLDLPFFDLFQPYNNFLFRKYAGVRNKRR